MSHEDIVELVSVCVLCPRRQNFVQTVIKMQVRMEPMTTAAHSAMIKRRFVLLFS